MNASVFIAASIDGFIARKSGSIDWLPAEDANEDYGYKGFIDSVDAIVMGRNTFESVLSMGWWQYEDKPVIVLSHYPLNIPSKIKESVTRMSEDPLTLVSNLEKLGYSHLYVDGGMTIQSFLEAGLISQLIITRIPVLIGNGIPLFGPLTHDIRLQHLLTRQYKNGLVQSHYRVLETVNS